MAAVYKSLSKSNGHKDDSSSLSTTEKKNNKQRVLLLSSRGISYRHRHLLLDLAALLPHARRDAKLDTKSKLYQLNELAELYNCNNVLFFEARKGKDLYLWISKAPNGPTFKMHLQNLHTMSELHFTGNCLKGSRPILSFSSHFDSTPHLKLMRELFTHVFGVPPAARKSKPFIDHVMAFTYADGKVWVRCYQIVENESIDGATAVKDADVAMGEGADDMEDDPANDSKSAPTSKTKSKKKFASKPSTAGVPSTTNVTLLEIGPRFVLTPIVVQEGSFGGPLLYENREFVSPNVVRGELRRRKAGRYAERAEREKTKRVKDGELGLRTDVDDEDEDDDEGDGQQGDGGVKRKRRKGRPEDELDGGVLFR